MEHQLWKAIIAILATLDKPRKSSRQKFSDEDIVKVYFWSVLHDRPIEWALQRNNWPIHLRKQKLPSSSTMSRRLRTESVKALLDALAQRVLAPKEPGIFWMIDGKPLPISGCSGDQQAGYGRAASCKAKGYKMHAIVGSDGSIAEFRVAPMNTDERVMAERMLKSAPIQGYVVADANYDSNPLHNVCVKRGNLQLVTRRRYGPGYGMGHRKQSPGRMRSKELTENPNPAFADRLLRDRDGIERYFGNCSNWGGGLTCLPPWVRTHRRVHRWVQAKLTLSVLKRTDATTTCVA